MQSTASSFASGTAESCARPRRRTARTRGQIPIAVAVAFGSWCISIRSTTAIGFDSSTNGGNLTGKNTSRTLLHKEAQYALFVLHDVAFAQRRLHSGSQRRSQVSPDRPSV